MKEINLKLRLKDLAKEDRPREKLLLKGINALSDAELLAIIIGSGNKKETVVELSQRILQTINHDLNQLGNLSIKYLVNNFNGIGEVKAISIVAALELGKRRNASKVPQKTIIKCSQDIYNYFYSILCDLPYEEFWALFLSRSNQILEKMKVSQGGISETVVDGRLIYKKALNCLATGIILCHNHPGGNVLPSRQDDVITEKLKEGIGLLGMRLIDHIILCGGHYYSYADEGKV
jgi:DNA repair protein RadC